MLRMRRAGPGKDAGELRPGIRRTHVNNADRLKPRLRRLDAKQPWRFPALDTAPELALRGDDEVLIKRIGVRHDFDPLAAAGNDREYRGAGRNDPHIML